MNASAHGFNTLGEVIACCESGAVVAPASPLLSVATLLTGVDISAAEAFEFARLLRPAALAAAAKRAARRRGLSRKFFGLAVPVPEPAFGPFGA